MLNTRLQDAQPDLELEGPTAFGDLFAALAAQQLQRVKDDARLLLVPTADADDAAARARHAAWRAPGLDLLNLAGLFISVVGALLLGQLVVQTLGEVFEGVKDWSQGHQHEAYRVRLRERLDLPGQPWAMRYPDSVTLSSQQVNDLAAAVLANETTEALTDSLVNRTFWETYLREQQRALFEALRTDYLQRRANLRVIQPPLSAEQLRSQFAELDDQEQRDTERLRAGLTESHLRGQNRGDG